jgi:hypothetical protein
MKTDNFCFYLQNRVTQTSQTGGQQYSDTSPFSIPCCVINVSMFNSNDLLANPAGFNLEATFFTDNNNSNNSKKILKTVLCLIVIIHQLFSVLLPWIPGTYALKLFTALTNPMAQ